MNPSKRPKRVTITRTEFTSFTSSYICPCCKTKFLCPTVRLDVKRFRYELRCGCGQELIIDELDKDHVAPDTEKLNNEWWVAEIRNELRKARAKFSRAHNLTGALAEEAGEAIKEAMHFYNGEPSSRLHLIKECIQAAVVAIRLAEEGDPLFKVPKLDKANER